MIFVCCYYQSPKQQDVLQRVVNLKVALPVCSDSIHVFSPYELTVDGSFNLRNFSILPLSFPLVSIMLLARSIRAAYSSKKLQTLRKLLSCVCLHFSSITLTSDLLSSPLPYSYFTIKMASLNWSSYKPVILQDVSMLACLIRTFSKKDEAICSCMNNAEETYLLPRESSKVLSRTFFYLK